MSPVVLREGPFTVVIYTKDHLPAHVHVKSAGNEARVALDPIEVMKNWGFKPGEIRTVLKLIQVHQQDLLGKWDELYLGE